MRRNLRSACGLAWDRIPTALHGRRTRSGSTVRVRLSITLALNARLRTGMRNAKPNADFLLRKSVDLRQLHCLSIAVRQRLNHFNQPTSILASTLVQVLLGFLCGVGIAKPYHRSCCLTMVIDDILSDSVHPRRQTIRLLKRPNASMNSYKGFLQQIVGSMVVRHPSTNESAGPNSDSSKSHPLKVRRSLQDSITFCFWRCVTIGWHAAARVSAAARRHAAANRHEAS